MKKWFRPLLLVTAFLWVGCQAAASLDQPPEIVYGEDTCDRCLMIISEPRYAAASVSADGEAYRFDGVGDMVAYYQASQQEMARFWVHDYETEEWLNADEAHFVISDALITPMGHGIVAFGSRAAAEAMAAGDNGTVFDFPTLLSQAEAGLLQDATADGDGHGNDHDHNNDHNNDHDHDNDHDH